MTTTLDPHDAPLTGDDLLIDALLREHARAGKHADEAFLARLDAAFDTGESPVTDMPEAAKPGRGPLIARAFALAACVALAAVIIWQTVRTVEDGITLATPLPPELIEGTPKPIKTPQGGPLPRLEQAPAKAAELLVPVGTTLLSKGKPVTSSDENPIIGSLDLVTDGDKDAGDGYFVELWEGLQWVQIDLEKTSTINAVWLWHFHSQRRAYHDVIVQVSDDPEFKRGVTTVFNNDYDNSAGIGKGPDNPYVETHFGKLIDAKGTSGRYIRLYSAGNSSNEMNHYIEVEIFGTAQ